MQKFIGYIFIMCVILLFSFDLVHASTAPEPTPPDEPTTQVLWWFDATTLYCQETEFTGSFAYQGLRTFDTESSCESNLSQDISDNGIRWYFDDSSNTCVSYLDTYVGNQFAGSPTYATEEMCIIDTVQCTTDDDCSDEQTCPDGSTYHEVVCQDGSCEQQVFTGGSPCFTSGSNCNMLWWYDSTTTICQQKEFCDLYAYQGLRTFEQRSSCEHSLGHNVITIGDDGNNQAERISVSVMNETDIISNATNPDIRNLAGKGVQTVTISHEGKQLLQFDFDFNESVLNLTEAIFKKSSNAESRSWVVINNLSLTQNESKTLYVDKKIGTDVCVLDREVSSIEEFSNDCSAVDETLFNNCDATGQTIGSYTCTDLGDQFRIEGLSHSAVTEVATTYLEIFDTSDLQAVHEGDLIRFSANYTNLSSSNPINGANCDIWFEDLGWEDMVYVSGTYVYERSYDSGVHSFNVSCSASGYETLQVSDDFEVYAQVTSVPEFNMYGLVLGMLLVATMLTVMRRRLIN